ncbi:MAG TPA: Xaa-Pro peptidase family protein [Chloroflexia bacterium]|nr:Xaa-Pro peptidase family protein [Chloroflexia bacterium]
MTNRIVNEKLDQAVAILDEQGLDMWITYVQETTLTPDPCMDLIAGLDMTWHSAFIVSRTGERIAVVGRYDAENVQAIGGYTQVVSYDQSIRPGLLETVKRLDPQTIALNYSEGDAAASGLTHGLFLDLQRTLADTPYPSRFVSAEKFIAALRGRKSPSEVALIKAAIDTTERLYAQVSSSLEVGQSEREIADRLTASRKELGLGTAWGEDYCPIVNASPDSAVGHAAPGDLRTASGQLLHLDFGVKQDGFCSDLQRMWYFLEEGETQAPDDVRRAWDACWGAIDAGAALLKPGVRGWEVDAAARKFLVDAGYPEYQHALGHHLGRVAHDGSTLLGPRWDRYGQTPYGIVEAGNVFTLELGTLVSGRGYIGLEEDVLVTDSGLEWLSTPQREIWLV